MTHIQYFRRHVHVSKRLDRYTAAELDHMRDCEKCLRERDDCTMLAERAEFYKKLLRRLR